MPGSLWYIVMEPLIPMVIISISPEMVVSLMASKAFRPPFASIILSRISEADWPCTKVNTRLLMISTMIPKFNAFFMLILPSLS
jgi:hypothetical protein